MKKCKRNVKFECWLAWTCTTRLTIYIVATYMKHVTKFRLVGHGTYSTNIAFRGLYDIFSSQLTYLLAYVLITSYLLGLRNKL